ncbi:hypothetical protein BVY04_04650 [bacterium M21]|nr:hypothetical protein BVY04_04650 [bacterium M21]
MIRDALKVIEAKACKHLKTKRAGSSEALLKLCPVVDETGRVAIPLNTIGMSMVNVEQERVTNGGVRTMRVDNKVSYKPADLRLYVDVLFTANFAKNNYEDGLSILSDIIIFFQENSVFTRNNTPNLPAGQDRLIMSLSCLTMDQQFHFWSVFGGNYLPSVIYKLSLVQFSSATTMREGVTPGAMDTGN